MNSKFLRFFFSFSSTITLVYLLNTSINRKPPIGKLFDPFNGFWQNAKEQPINIKNSNLKLVGLKDKVKINFDKNLIPHVKTNNEEDVYFVQGYLSAFHRLWKMEFTAYAAAGRLSEIFGYNKKIYEFDKLQRQKGLSFAAENVLKSMLKHRKTAKYLKSYCAGVNAYISSLNYKNFPIEYKLLSYKPTIWTPYKVALVMISVIENLSGKDSALEYTNALEKFGRQKFDFLYPDFPKGILPIAKNRKWKFNPIKIKKPSFYIPDGLRNISLPNRMKVHSRGSNCWAVSKSKTKSKCTYFVNDIHLGFSIPSLMYLMHISSPTTNVIGSLIPGMPCFGLGFNQNISWGITNSLINNRDWYLVEFEDASMKEYKYDGKILKTFHKEEEIKIRGRNSIKLKVIYTHIGPVIYDKKLNQKEGRHIGFAMKWSGHNPGNILLAFHNINNAKNYRDFRDGIYQLDCPGLNIGFASKYGNIGMHVGGLYPAKWKEQGRFILDGNSSKHEWQGYIPKEHNPYEYNPRCNFVASANEHPTYSSYPYYMHGPFYRYFRNLTIHKLLKKRNDLELKDMIKMQLSNFSQCAFMLLPSLLLYIDKSLLNKEQLDMYNIVSNWQYNYDRDRLGPTIFHVWQKEIRKRLWSFFKDYDVKLRWPSLYTTVEIIVNHPNSKFLNFGKHKNMKNLVNSAFISTTEKILSFKKEHKTYIWGKYRKININHVIPNFKSFGIKDVFIGGDRDTLNANENSSGGVSCRLITVLKENSIEGNIIYPGGQPGNVGNKHYNQFMKKFINGEYIRLSLKDFGKKSDRYSLQLIPKK